ncbi:MAG: HlyD family efflux transporter periplasmic adaptor subunit [Oscillospiraceae bacterium]|nr:HlyD family efflux transporter periplasmic adaptor subunit [Oscillospiraceae bacterium]
MNIENKQMKARRDLIKNIAIIFLAIMLVLTFFSNTVMNMSLPEVSAQYAVAETVSEQIRGSGTVKAGQSYEVMVNETRKIRGVNVKQGDKVNQGDIIYTLEGSESEELKTAEKTLREMELAYQKALIDSESGSKYITQIMDINNSREDIAEAESDIARFGDEENLKVKYASDYYAIEKLREETELLKKNAGSVYAGKSAAELEVMAEELNAAVTCLDTDDYSALPKEWYDKITAAAEKAAVSDKETLNTRKTAIEGYIAALDTEDMLALPTKYYNRVRELISKKSDAQAEFDKRKKNLEEIQGEISGNTDYSEEIRSLSKQIEKKVAEHSNILGKIVGHSYEDSAGRALLFDQANSLSIEIKQLNDDMAELMKKQQKGSAVINKLNAAQTMYNKAENELEAAADALNKAKKQIKTELIDEYTDVKAKLEALEGTELSDDAQNAVRAFADLKKEAKLSLKADMAAVNAAKSYSEKKAEYDQRKAEFDIKLTSDKAAMEDTLKEKKRSLEKMEQEFSVTQITGNAESRKAALDLQEQALKIEDQKALIQSYKDKAAGGSITAPVSGVISSLTYTAGESTAAGNAAAVIDMTDKGYSISFSVKTEQAKKLKTGTNADVANNYFGSDITAVLTAIKTDTSNPQTNKLLEFTVTGSEVTPGDTITLNIGAKGQQYPAVIPKSAVREDNNGKYVLTVQSKASPLGSRYYAVRYPVEIIAQNDSLAAVSGLSGSEFVITASSVPVGDGEQVKLSDSESSSEK